MEGIRKKKTLLSRYFFFLSFSFILLSFLYPSLFLFPFIYFIPRFYTLVLTTLSYFSFEQGTQILSCLDVASFVS